MDIISVDVAASNAAVDLELRVMMVVELVASMPSSGVGPTRSSVSEPITALSIRIRPDAARSWMEVSDNAFSGSTTAASITALAVYLDLLTMVGQCQFYRN